MGEGGSEGQEGTGGRTLVVLSAVLCWLYAGAPPCEAHGHLHPAHYTPSPPAPVHQGPWAAGTHLTHTARSLQENVSCLNTSLVILMLARRKERLPLYLRLLQRMEHSKKYPGFLLNNFHNLLRFWQQHYLHKDKDSTCLENVSAPPLRAGRQAAGTAAQAPWRGRCPGS